MAVTSTPPSRSAFVTARTSSTVMTWSPTIISAPLPTGANAAQPPRARPGFTSVPPTVTCRSERGMLKRMTPPGIALPSNPNAFCTGFHSGAAPAATSNNATIMCSSSERFPGAGSLRPTGCSGSSYFGVAVRSSNWMIESALVHTPNLPASLVHVVFQRVGAGDVVVVLGLEAPENPAALIALPCDCPAFDREAQVFQVRPGIRDGKTVVRVIAVGLREHVLAAGSVAHRLHHP